MPRMVEALGPSASVTSIEAMQLVSLPPTRMSRDALLLKRAFDVVGSLVLLVVTAPALCGDRRSGSSSTRQGLCCSGRPGSGSTSGRSRL